MAAAGAIVQVVGMILQSRAQDQADRAAARTAGRRREEAEFEAQQLDVDAGQSLAASQHGAVDVARQESFLQSTLLARAAASGAGASDTTVEQLSGKVASEGKYRQGLALYEGEAQARLDRLRATAVRMSGDIGMAGALEMQKAGQTASAATLFSGTANTASMYQKYYSGPKGSSAPDNPGSLNDGGTVEANSNIA